MEIPVYLFTGFLEAGKTKFIQDVLSEQVMVENGNTLLLVCEEGTEEFDCSSFKSPNIYCEYIEEESQLSAEFLDSLQKKHNAVFVMIEYNGVWQIDSLYKNLPENWSVAQELLIIDAETIENYNKNMRSLVVDKLSSCDFAAFNRVKPEDDRMPLHKLVRGVSRNARILYDLTTGVTEYDEIQDPLPFDVNAETIEIKDGDFAYWYRDICEDMQKYDGKKVKFKGIVLKDESVPKGIFICGRHIMTCCADDIKYSAFVCKWKESEKLKSYSWITLTGKISVRSHKIYGGVGPVIQITQAIPASPPEQELATFD